MTYEVIIHDGDETYTLQSTYKTRSQAQEAGEGHLRTLIHDITSPPPSRSYEVREV